MLLRAVARNFSGGGDAPENPKCVAAGYHSYVLERDEYERRRGVNLDVAKTKKCKSASVNPRGSYTSHLVPCTFQFFQIPNEQPGDLNDHIMSTACFDTSPMQNVPEIEDYIVNWPDECVAGNDSFRCGRVIFEVRPT